jgi:glycosyltransferase involved in cell wall biosynthesis
MKPETSVVIPVRNGVRYLAQAITSVLSQLGRNDEVLVVDDGSTDETASVLANLTDPRLRRLASDGRGVSVARNMGLTASRGEFVAFLDHDDLWPAGRHRNLMAVLIGDETLDAVLGRIACLIEPDARASGQARVEGHHAWWLVGSGLYRRRLIERIGGFAEDMPAGEDVDFHLRLREAGLRWQLCDSIGLIRRLHGANATNDPAVAVPARLQVLRRSLSRARPPTGAKTSGS